MTESKSFPRNTPFKPSASLIPWFMIDFLLTIAFIVGCIVIPMTLSAELDRILIGQLAWVCIIIVVLFFVWTRLYYDSMAYELHDDELRWRRGVWFRTTGIVPYNRITNLDVKQGPVMRWLGISTIAVQTAGFGGQSVPEIKIEAIEHAEELREILRRSVRACSSIGDGTGTGPVERPVSEPVATTGTSILILDELRKIRVLLEQQKK